MTGARHAAALLAGGSSRRLGRSKPLLRIDGATLLRRAVEGLLATAPLQIIVVLRPSDHEVEAELRGLPVEVCPNPRHAEGMAMSLRAALLATHQDAQGLLVCVCDQPVLRAEHLRLLCERWRQAPQHAAASGYAGTVGVPALLPREWFPAVAGLRGDQGARALLRARPEQVSVVPEETLAWDIDTPADVPAGA